MSICYYNHKYMPISLVQVQLSVDSLVGVLPAYQEAVDLCRSSVRPSALLVEAVLADRYDTFGVPLRTHYAEASFQGCSWDSSLSFCVRVRWR